VLVLLLEPAGLPRFLTTTAKKGCEFNQKRCEFKIFHFYIPNDFLKDDILA
jgi:hypothetical protein